eukprot:31371-Pelagococcus_subviridis.AAC.1
MARISRCVRSSASRWMRSMSACVVADLSFPANSSWTCLLMISSWSASGSTSTTTVFSTISSSPLSSRSSCAASPRADAPAPAPPPSCAFRRAISSWNSRNIASFGSSLMRGLFLMFFALFAYRNVLIVSSKL